LSKELGIKPTFKDHFSRQSDCYAKYRPSYPAELFAFLASAASRQDRAWDCATGNGQAARGLANHFDTVVATDASEAQIGAAMPHERVRYSVARAESSGLKASHFDLLTVGQAFHWFDEDQFFAEAARVLRPDGVLALWSYDLCSVDADCDRIVSRLYDDIVGEFWPAERAILERGYDSAKLPGDELKAPPFKMSLSWAVDGMLGYLRTWSACKRYAASHGADPVGLIEAELRRVWGEQERAVHWPLNLTLRRLQRPVTIGT